MIKSHNLTIRLTELPREGPPTAGHPVGKMPKIDHLVVFTICVFLEYQSVSGPNYNYSYDKDAKLCCKICRIQTTMATLTTTVTNAMSNVMRPNYETPSVIVHAWITRSEEQRTQIL